MVIYNVCMVWTQCHGVFLCHTCLQVGHIKVDIHYVNDFPPTSSMAHVSHVSWSYDQSKKFYV